MREEILWSGRWPVGGRGSLMEKMPHAPTLALTGLFQLADLALYGRLAVPEEGSARAAGEVHNN